MYDLTFIDVSQFALDPQRTGVQRVLAKTVEFMPRARIMPFRVIDERHVAILDPALFDLIIRYFERQTASARGRVIGSDGRPTSISTEALMVKLATDRPLAVLEASRFFSRAQRILNLESFSRPDRSRFYLSCPSAHRSKVFHFIHDFLLFEAPGVFPQLNWRRAADYVLLFEAYAAAGGFFVSTPDMARRVSEYFKRPPSDVKVVHFGGDLGVGIADAGPPGRRRVTVIGTIEPRKYPAIVVDALDQVAADDPTLDCAIIGNWGWVTQETRRKIEEIFARGRVRHLTQVGDAELSARIAATDLGIYVSSVEGFGIPVIEFAAAGVPLITNEAVPAAALLDSKQCTILKEVGVAELVAGIRRSLGQKHARTSYYPWTWQGCATDILDWDPAGTGARDKLERSAACWRAAVGLVRELRGRRLAWEELKLAVRASVLNDKRLEALARPVAAKETAMDTLVENLSEIVSDNLWRVFWADLLQVKPLLVELIACLSAPSSIQSIIRAFTAFLGREIDNRAAAEAIHVRDPVRTFQRIVELIHSEEAASSLGECRAVALRTIIGEIQPIISVCLERDFDLFKLKELLGLPPPSVAEVLEAEELATDSRRRLRLLVHVAAARPLAGDSLDLLLEEIAALSHEKRPQVTTMRATEGEAAGVAAAADPLSPTRPPAPLPTTPFVAASEGATREVPIYADSYWEGWYSLEYAGLETFRWMGKESVIHNPVATRAVRGLVLEVQTVYGADVPLATAFIGETAAAVSVESDPSGVGWRVFFDASGDSVLSDSVRLKAVTSDSPARAEGLPDARELSFCVTGATFVYAD